MTDSIGRSEPFVRMAAAIELNVAGQFGGAVVIVPPKDAGDPVETLILDNSQSPAEFWAALKTRCEIKLSQLIEAERNMATFGRPR